MAPFTPGRGRTFGRTTQILAASHCNLTQLVVRPAVASVKRAYGRRGVAWNFLYLSLGRYVLLEKQRRV